ncbi:MAG: EAL domain-containing protein [bacterium]
MIVEQTEQEAPDRLTQSIASRAGKFAVGIIALTNLAELGERFGEDGEILIAEAFRARLTALLRPDDDLIVIAKDSVCIVLDNLIDAHHLELAGLKITRLFEMPFEIAGQMPQLSIRAGLVYAGRRTRLTRTADELYQQAESTCMSAIFENKAFVIASTEHIAPVDHDWQLSQRIKTAMDNHHISFDYQPKFDLKSMSVSGGEALIRWRDNGRIIPPDEYLAALSDDMLWELTIYGYRRVLREIIEYDLCVPVSFNIDPSSLTQADFIDFIRRETHLWGVDPAQIMLEITENKELFDLQASRSLLQDIRQLGFKISLDDFGSDHSNMLRIRELPLDEIKIDRSLCGNVLEDDDARQISQTVIALANALNIPCIAEGIEDQATLDILRELDCGYGQGFHLGLPVSIRDFAELQAKKSPD